MRNKNKMDFTPPLSFYFFLFDEFENGWVGMTPIGDIQSAITIIQCFLIVKCECNKTNYEQEIKGSQIKSKTFFEYLTATLNFGT